MKVVVKLHRLLPTAACQLMAFTGVSRGRGRGLNRTDFGVQYQKLLSKICRKIVVLAMAMGHERK